MSWRLAESLKKLREQINEAYPNRDKSSDGSIGDTKHSARKSDHNPNAAGVVTAIDIDEDLTPTNTVAGIIAQLQISRDPRIKYIIYEGKITVKGDITKWKPYTGVNPHRHHAHISVSSDLNLYDKRYDWKIAGLLPVIMEVQGKTHTVVSGDSLWKLASVYQISVSELMHLNGLTSDIIKVGQVLKLR